MTDERTMDRFVKAWLEDGVNDLPDRVLKDVLVQVPTIRQRGLRRHWWQMPSDSIGFRLAAAAMAVFVVAATALVVANFEPRGFNGTTPTPSPSPRWYVPPSPGPIEAGSFVVYDPFPMQLELTLGPGWNLSPDGIGSDAVVIYRGGRFSPNGRGLIVAMPSQLFNDRCDATAGTFDPGPSLAAFADAFYRQRIGPASDLTDTTLDGYSGRHLQTMNLVSATDHSLGFLCGSGYPRWPALQNLPRSAAGETDEYWILDVAGKRLVLDAYSFGQAPSRDIAELRAIVESIQIAP